MNAKSPHDFKWSIKIDGNCFVVGLASNSFVSDQIVDKDKNAILLVNFQAIACRTVTYGIEKDYSADVQKLKNETEEVIYFKFKPELKKFSISWVSAKELNIKIMVSHKSMLLFFSS